MGREQWWNDTDRGNLNYSERNFSCLLCFYHKSQQTYLCIIRPILAVYILTTNLLTHGNLEVSLHSFQRGFTAFRLDRLSSLPVRLVSVSVIQRGTGTTFFSKYFVFPLAVSFHNCFLAEAQTFESSKTSKNQLFL